MITKLAKAKDSWVIKVIFFLVGISFISLFGVTGYISSATSNKVVLQVGKKKISQSEFSYRLRQEANSLRSLAGDDFEMTDEMKTTLSENVLKQLIDENVIDQSSAKYGVHFPRAFVQQVIFSQPEFQNPANGQFHPDLFKRYLSVIGLSEQEYINTIERAMARKVMITDLVDHFSIPNVLSQAIHKMDNQRKSFKYTIISPADIKIERQISDEEIEQYFADFADDFIIPEVRTAKVIFIPNELVLQKYATSDELISDYFNQHKKELDQPEKRQVSQMVFMNKETAEKALDELLKGSDFSKTAEEFKAENADNPTLGVVSYDELADDLASPVFEMNINEPKVIQVADTWQVINVSEITPAKEAVFEEVKDQIVEILNDENLYDALHDAKADIDDAVNGGKTLDEVADMMGVQVFEVTNIKEDEKVSNVPEYAQDLASSLDFNEFVFSYGLDEITSAEEFDNGIAVIEVTNIIDAHMPEIADVRDDIIALWTVQEKNALAKETADNIVNEVEDGSELTTAAKARDLEAFRSEPINRNENFANLTPFEISDLFIADQGSVKLFEHSNNTYIIATPFETFNYSDELTEEKLNDVEERAQGSLLKDMAQAMLDSYAKDFKVKIDYKLAGFNE